MTDYSRPVVDADGHVLHAPHPADLVTLVTPDPRPGGGLLYLGGSWLPYPRRFQGFDMVMTVCWPDEGARSPATGRHLARGFSDGPDLPLDLDDMVREVVQTVEYGHSVLVRCYTGQNRSGLVAALAMCQMHGMTGAQVIDHLRAVRAPYVLCNPAFEAHVRAAHPTPAHDPS